MTDILTTPQALETANVLWNLKEFYASPEDPQIETDLQAALAAMENFAAAYRGKLGTQLGAALDDYITLDRQLGHIYTYFQLAGARDTADTVLRRAQSRVFETLATANGRHLTFFSLEIGRLTEAEVAAQQTYPTVLHHLPMITHIRALARYDLSEDVEKALTLRSPFGPGEWNDMMDELESRLTFELDGKVLRLPEILNVMAHDPDATVRARALEIVNAGLHSQNLTYFQARALNVAAGAKITEDAERGYAHAMAARNLGNKVDDATVKALHDAVEREGASLSTRFYRLKAKWLGLPVLAWSDRNAPMPFASQRKIPWSEACAIVSQAYHGFSPVLGDLVDRVINEGWVDAPPAPAKVSGAFDLTCTLPQGNRSYMLLNYLGTPDDVSTLAHELGHAVHGLLAAEAQGPLMWHAPMAYAETASIFGEMITFENLMQQTNDDEERLGMLMDKLNSSINTVVRQISFSVFEQEVFARRKEGKLSTEDFDTIWQNVTTRFYGPEGDVFTYQNIAHLWSYVGHFHSPFYVYAYAFGELFTQSLIASRAQVGEKFVPLYLDLLRAGGTKTGVDLLKPFGLNPTQPDFWSKGLHGSLGAWLTEAERLTAKLKMDACRRNPHESGEVQIEI